MMTILVKENKSLSLIHILASASSVQAALKGLLEKDFVTQEKGVYQIYDRFLGIWLKENY